MTKDGKLCDDSSPDEQFIESIAVGGKLFDTLDMPITSVSQNDIETKKIIRYQPTAINLLIKEMIDKYSGH